jgi:hypothetical protein
MRRGAWAKKPRKKAQILGKTKSKGRLMDYTDQNPLIAFRHGIRTSDLALLLIISVHVNIRIRLIP